MALPLAAVELDSEAIQILSKILKREEYKTLSDVIRHLNNLCNIQEAVINKQDKEIDKLEKEIERFKEIDKLEKEIERLKSAGAK